ncbi:hypothetical protein NKG94_50435 [Micromonospora sp. M12]
MVDRIVPASTPSTLQRAATTLGVRDLAAVDTETYRQWVLTDDFPGGRPTWEAAGAILTTDVTPWEQLKLRILNGVHSTAAYLGALAGCETIAETLALPGMADLLQRLIIEDITPTLDPPAGVQVSTYGATVLSRFANPLSNTGPCRWPWTDRRSFPNVLSEQYATGVARAIFPRMRPWPSQPG